MQPPIVDKPWSACLGPCLQDVLAAAGVAAHVTTSYEQAGPLGAPPSPGLLAVVKVTTPDLDRAGEIVLDAQARWEIFRRATYCFVDWQRTMQASLAALPYCPATITIEELRLGPETVAVHPRTEWRTARLRDEPLPPEGCSIPHVTLRLCARQTETWDGLQLAPEIRDRLLNWQAGFFHEAAIHLSSLSVRFSDPSYGAPLQLVPYPEESP